MADEQKERQRVGVSWKLARIAAIRRSLEDKARLFTDPALSRVICDDVEVTSLCIY